MSRITTRAHRAGAYASQLHESFSRSVYWTKGWPHLTPPLPPAGETHAKLVALGPDPDPDDVDRIACRPVTFACCDQCGETVATVVEFDINCGEFSLELCGGCCSRLGREMVEREEMA